MCMSGWLRSACCVIPFKQNTEAIPSDGINDKGISTRVDMPLFNMADRILFVSVSVQMWQVFSIRHELDSN